MNDLIVVKVIKADNLNVWYRDHIGYFCEVMELDDIHYLVAGSDFELIAISDCEIIKDGSIVNEKSQWISA